MTPSAFFKSGAPWWPVLTLNLVMCLAACSPQLDWRVVRPADAGISALFPCKPTVTSHPATAAEPVAMGLAECKAGSWTFSLAWADLADPALVGPALVQMPRSLATKLNAPPAPPLPLAVPGMTANPAAQVQVLVGDKQRARVAVFTRGLRVYQLVLLGAQDNPAAWDAFLAAVKLDS